MIIARVKPIVSVNSPLKKHNPSQKTLKSYTLESMTLVIVKLTHYAFLQLSSIIY